MKLNQPWMILAAAALAAPVMVGCSHDENGGPDPLMNRQPAPPSHADMTAPPTASPGNPLYGTKPTPPPEVTTPGVTPQQTQQTPAASDGTGLGTSSNGSALTQRRLQNSPPPSTQPTGNISVGPGAATDTGGTVVTPRTTPMTPEQQLQQQNR